MGQPSDSDEMGARAAGVSASKQRQMESPIFATSAYFERLPYSIVRKKNPARKFQENSKNGRALRAKRAAHALFWESSGFVFSIQY